MNSCPICMNNNISSEFIKESYGGTYTIARCGNCTVEFVSPLPSTEFLLNFQQNFFAGDENYEGIDNRGYARAYWLKEKKIINSLGYESGRILDIGCNGGHFLDNMGDNWEKHGIELAEHPAAIAKSKGINVYNQPFEDVQFPDSYFDVVTMYNLIEHLRDPSTSVAKVSRILRPGGLFVVLTGVRNSVKARIKKTSWHMYCPPVHMFFFTHQSLLLMLRKASLQQCYYKYTSGGMAWFNKNSLVRKGVGAIELFTLKSIFDRKPLYRLPFYDHLYLYAIRR